MRKWNHTQQFGISNMEHMVVFWEYTMIIKNVTRNIDIMRLHAFLQSKLVVGFQLEELDQGGPMSHTSWIGL
ncbi:hypothetical protein PsorP6_007621 [Peronosclerospora sorghi]|uniref:Uncharacterized protein n=1 Tax=Peronosclerospora sorghi TaxID=230839 RepID=A0ACC0W6S5_9STRA|nr:hypothetical protein PsorP6_007621 [Peronosclerospora sorghi]